jgi:hypothetical protein
VILLATIQYLFRRAWRGAGGLLLTGMALSLVAAPLHRAAGHEHGDREAEHSHEPGNQPHHCPVCAFVKGQVDTPDFSPAIVVFVRAEVCLPVAEVFRPTSVNADSLPPGRAPPVSLIPS